MRKELYVLLLMISGILSACSDEEDEMGLTVTQISISEAINSDGGTVNKKNIYSFTAGKLRNHTTSQEFYGQSMHSEANLSYSNNQTVITHSEGNIATYTLGDNGYAQRCVYSMSEQIREYDFSYSDNQLTQINEKIDGEPFSSIKLEYNSGDLRKIETKGLNIMCQTGNDINRYNLPCTILSDIHPLSLHIDAIFAGLLGKQSAHWVIQTAPERNNNEWTEYRYQLDAEQKPILITALTTSTGTVYDINGKPSEVTRTDKRMLHFEIK